MRPSPQVGPCEGAASGVVGGLSPLLRLPRSRGNPASPSAKQEAGRAAAAKARPLRVRRRQRSVSPASPSLGETQTGSYQTGSHQKGRFIPPKQNLSHLLFLLIRPRLYASDFRACRCDSCFTCGGTVISNIRL